MCQSRISGFATVHYMYMYRKDTATRTRVSTGTERAMETDWNGKTTLEPAQHPVATATETDKKLLILLGLSLSNQNCSDSEEWQ